MANRNAELEKIERLEDEQGELEILLIEEYRYHLLRAEALKRELIRRGADID